MLGRIFWGFLGGLLVDFWEDLGGIFGRMFEDLWKVLGRIWGRLLDVGRIAQKKRAKMALRAKKRKNFPALRGQMFGF